MNNDKATLWLLKTREEFKKKLANKQKPPDGVLVGPIKSI